MAEAQSLSAPRPAPWPGASGRMAVLALLLVVGCAARSHTPVEADAPPLRVSELLDQGDPTRRASLRLVERGLAADATARFDQAIAGYERAIRVDPTNPYAYLALSRHYVERRDSERALEVLGQAEVLLGGRGPDAPGVQAHLLGLRGAALAAAGRPTDGQPLLERAAQLAPSVWADGFLSADELR